MDEKISIAKSGRIIRIKVKGLRGLSKFIGLMFKKRSVGNLLFEFENDVKIPFHSFFVFFSFLIIWIDEDNKVLGWKVIKPFTFRIIPEREFRKVIEIPFNDGNMKIIDFVTKNF